MAEEARVLLKFQLAQRRIKDVMEMTDPDDARIIRSIKGNSWQVSGKLAREYPQLEDRLLALRMVEAVQSAFEPRFPIRAWDGSEGSCEAVWSRLRSP